MPAAYKHQRAAFRAFITLHYISEHTYKQVSIYIEVGRVGWRESPRDAVAVHVEHQQVILVRLDGQIQSNHAALRRVVSGGWHAAAVFGTGCGAGAAGRRVDACRQHPPHCSSAQAAHGTGDCKPCRCCGSRGPACSCISPGHRLERAAPACTGSHASRQQATAANTANTAACAAACAPCFPAGCPGKKTCAARCRAPCSSRSRHGLGECCKGASWAGSARGHREGQAAL